MLGDEDNPKCPLCNVELLVAGFRTLAETESVVMRVDGELRTVGRPRVNPVYEVRCNACGGRLPVSVAKLAEKAPLPDGRGSQEAVA